MDLSDPCYAVTLTFIPEAVVQRITADVFRHDLNAPGFACLSFPRYTHTFDLRKAMVRLQQSLSHHFQRLYGIGLGFYSMGRFDQRKTTRLHLDGGPACSFLLLGYEPSLVASRFLTADHSRCAYHLGLSPRQFLDQQNPMLTDSGRAAIKPWTKEVSGWDDATPRIVVINNSSLSHCDPLPGLGILHGAEILHIPSPVTPRIINSTMIVPTTTSLPAQEGAIKTFLETTHISGLIL